MLTHKKNSLKIVTITSSVFAMGMSLATTAAETVKICDDLGEWPPFTYFARHKGEPTQEVQGFTVELVNKVFTEAGISYSIDLLPWKRCLAAVESGSYQMLLNATYNEEREKIFLFSDAHSYITPSVFFLKSAYPDGPQIQVKADLKNYRVGGIHGYNYDYYGLSETDVKNKGVYNYEALVQLLKRGHASIFVENVEILAGFHLVGKNYLEDSIGYKKIEDMPPTPVYMLFNKGEAGKRLKALIDQKLPLLSGSEHLSRFMKENELQPE